MKYDKRIRQGKYIAAKVTCATMLLFTSITGIACSKIETTDPVIVQAKTIETMENEYMVDIREIASYQETETGLQINLKDGTNIHVPKVENVTEYFYVICDIVNSYGEKPDDIYHTNLVVNMPNGELHDFTIEDPPAGNLDKAFFVTINQDNYENYKIGTVE